MVLKSKCKMVLFVRLIDCSCSQANVDASFSHAHSLYGFYDGITTDQRNLVRHKHTYDAQCDLTPNVSIRFARFPYLHSHRRFIRQVERGVPVVHMEKHNEDDCREKFNVPYHWCNAHVHGESIEQPWIEFNQVGGYTRQMNDANREDTIIAHINDWNYKKLINSCKLILSAIFMLWIEPDSIS